MKQHCIYKTSNYTAQDIQTVMVVEQSARLENDIRIFLFNLNLSRAFCCQVTVAYPLSHGSEVSMLLNIFYVTQRLTHLCGAPPLFNHGLSKYVLSSSGPIELIMLYMICPILLTRLMPFLENFDLFGNTKSNLSQQFAALRLPK